MLGSCFASSGGLESRSAFDGTGKHTEVNWLEELVASTVVPDSEPIVLAQAASPAANTFQVRISSGLDQKTALDLQRTLQADGYGPVNVVQKDGKYAIVIGAFPSESDAEGLLNDLKANGYNPERIQKAEEGGEVTISSAPKGQVFRVLIYELTTREEAEQVKKSLIADDYPSVEVAEEGGKFRIYMGKLPSESEAAKYQESLKSDGYATAQVVATADTSADEDVAPTGNKELSIPEDVASKLTAKDQETVKELAEQQSRVNRGTATASEIKELRERLKGIESGLRGVVSTVAEGEAKKRENQKQISDSYKQFDAYLLARKFDEAEKVLAEARRIDPSNPLHDWKEDRLRTAQRNTADSAAAPGTRSAAEEAKIRMLINEAKNAEAQKQYDIARGQWYEVLRLDPDNVEAKTKTIEMTKVMESSGQIASTSKGPSSKILIYVAVAGGVLLLIVLLVLILNMKRERELIRQVQELATQTADARSTSSFGPAILTAQPVAQPASQAEKKKKGKASKDVSAPSLPAAPPTIAGTSGLSSSPLFGSDVLAPAPMDFDNREDEQEEEAHEVDLTPPPVVDDHRMESGGSGEPDLVFIGGMDSSSDLLAPPSAQADSVDLGGINLGSPSTENLAPPVGSGMAPPNMNDLNLDDLLKQPFPFAGEENQHTARIEDIAPSVTPPVVTPQQISGFDETIGMANVAMGGSQASIGIPGPAELGGGMPSFTPPPAASGGTLSGGNGTYFSQTFEDEAPGTQPSGWQGDYDYASLTVDDKTAAGGAGRSLRFEKRTGAGSANYVCHFPNASGHVIIEFDMRCDDKNKYLLGFYVEKDEDFKQSVHTIVHRTDSKSQPSLRIQGEPIPYELGTWRHIKYDLQLLTGLVNAYVDDKHVVKDAKLPTNPAYVNTLSIRDNLATTGVLYLDNIKIYRG